MSPPPATVRTDLRARAAYAEGAGVHRIVPAAVARPGSVDELSAVLAWSGRRRLPVIPRGAGSSMGGGSVGPGLILDCSRLGGGVVTVDPARRLAQAAPGVTCEALDRAGRPHRLRMAVDPSSARFATSAGLVSTNAAGPRSFRNGSVRRWVAGLELMTADGARLRVSRGRPADPTHPGVGRFLRDVAPRLRAAAPLIRARFPATRKNSCGYALDAWLDGEDLVDLVVGSEGTLAVITGVTWRLEPLPEARGGVRVTVADDRELMRVLDLVRPYRPVAIELLDRTFLRFVAGGLSDATRSLALRAGAMLLIEFEGSTLEVHQAVATARAQLAPLAYEVAAGFSPAALEGLWAIRHAASPLLAGLGAQRRSLQIIEDGCVPVARLGEYLAALREIPDRHGIEAVVFGHAGDGHLHVNLLPDTTAGGWEERVRRVFADVSAIQLALGGTPAGEHGVGRLRTAVTERLYGPEIVALFRAVKAAFDPDGILNPGVLVPAPGASGGEPAGFKVGAGAADLPEDIARELRRIEQHGDWACDRLALADAASPESEGARPVAPR